MRKLIYFAVIVIIAIILFLTRGTWAPDDSSTDSESDSIAETAMENGDVMNLVMNDATTQVAELKAVDGSNSEGKGYRLIVDGMLYHSVTASMPDPAEGNSYEGWLVQTSPLKFFSTGVMEKNSDGNWMLEHINDQENPTYLKIVITEETIIAG